jgi:hypothetical protein
MANVRPMRTFSACIAFNWNCPSACVAFANRIVVASGFETTRPFDRVTVGGPNAGSGAGSLVTIGPLHGPL